MPPPSLLTAKFDLLALFKSRHQQDADIGFCVEPQRTTTRSHSGTLRPKLGHRVVTNESVVSDDSGNGQEQAQGRRSQDRRQKEERRRMEDRRKMEEHQQKPHRHSFHLLRKRGSEHNMERHKTMHQKEARLDLEIESPPLVFYGQPSQSSGALLSGQLKVFVEGLAAAEEEMEVEGVEMRFVLDYNCKKPFHAHCPECTKQTVVCTSWKFVQGPTKLAKGEHAFPFSFLLPGHLPASMNASMALIDYNLQATLTPAKSSSGSNSSPITLKHSLPVRRAIQPSETPRQSIRIFPPTNLTAHVSLPSIIHPIGEFNATLRLDGIIRRSPDSGTQTHWKLKRLTWKLDEVQKFIAPACPKHAAKRDVAPGEKVGISQQEVRTLNSAELKSGWKSDYSGPDGCVELEFPFSIRADARPVCDTKGEDGTEVSHHLVVEMIVAEEYAPIKTPEKVTPTGAARVLRMHFSVSVSERAGMGISWDEESPPLYENVPASPPGYGAVGVYEGTPIPAYEDLDQLVDSPGLGPIPGLSHHVGAGSAIASGSANPNISGLEYFPRFVHFSETLAASPDERGTGEGTGLQRAADRAESGLAREIIRSEDGLREVRAIDRTEGDLGRRLTRSEGQQREFTGPRQVIFEGLDR